MQTVPLRTTAELFCGIGGFRIAADRVGLRTVWANDVCAAAAKVYTDRFGADTFHPGDVLELVEAVPAHDVLTGGFPCQPFSAAGKKEGTRDPRGTLFQAIVDVVQRCQPRHFVLENVKRLLTMEQGSHFATVLSALSSLDYLIEWRVLNAQHFGLAQNRERVVLVGTRISADPQSVDVMSGLRLASGVELDGGPRGLRSMLSNIQNWQELNAHGAKFPFWGVAYGGRFVAASLPSFQDASRSVLIREVLESDPADEYDFTAGTLARLNRNELVNRFVHGVEVISNQGGGARMGYTIFGINGLAPTLTASTSRHYERYKIGEQYRRLTPVEYARLQGFRDDHCRAASSYDQYTLYGNAVPPPLVEWVLRRLVAPIARPMPAPRLKQEELFSA